MEVEFRELLNRLMESRRLSQSDIARAAVVDRSRVSQWRRGLGFPSPQTLERLADEYGLDLEQLQRVCGYRRQVTSSADPEELEFVAILRQVPSEKRSAARDMLLGLAAVQPVNKGAITRRATGPSTPRSRRHGLEGHASTSEDSADQGGLSIVSRTLKDAFAIVLSPFQRPIERTVFWPAAQSAIVA